MNESVHLLPTKLLVDDRLRIRETPKLLSECNIYDESAEAILKVKMTGVSYNKDFELFKLKNFPGKPVVPGNKTVAKLYQSFNSNVLPGKYLVYPYSNCLLQNSSYICENCQFLKDTGTHILNYNTMECHKLYKCLYNWEYGLTIDGGLQDFIKVESPENSLIKLPDTISIHDACFVFDLALPLYTFIKDKLSHSSSAKILIILNEIAKESNDILIVLRHFQIPQAQAHLVDISTIKSLTPFERKNSFKGYNYSLLFNTTPEAVEVGRLAISTGLEATKSRYHMALFDQYSPQTFIQTRNLDKENPDFTVLHFRLSYKDRLNCVELINIISLLNLATRANEIAASVGAVSSSGSGCSSDSSFSSPSSSIDELIKKESRPSISSIDTSASSISDSSIHLVLSTNTSEFNHTKNTKRRSSKNLRFRDGDSIIDLPGKQLKNYSWLWYERDFNLCSEHDQYDEDDEYDESCHTVRNINRLIRSNNQISRVCYTRKSRPSKLNAMVL